MLHPPSPILLTSIVRRGTVARVAGTALLALLAAACSSTDLSVSAPSTTKCQVAVTNSLPTAPPAGATGTLSVTTTRDCTWDAASTASWIEITSASRGQGSADVTYRVSVNSEPTTRRGTLSVNDTQLSVAQEPAPCRFSVTPASASVAADGAPVVVRVETHEVCAWTAIADAGWLAVGGAASRSGPGTVTVTVDANSGAGRSGTARVAGQLVRIDQAAAATPTPTPTPTPAPMPAPAPGPSPTPGPSPQPEPSPPPTPCSYAVSPLAVTTPAPGGTASVAVTTSTGCTWTAVSGASWLSVTGGAAGTGSGIVALAVAPNLSTSSRSSSLTVAGQTVTVTQDAAAPACSYTITPSQVATNDAAATIDVAVTTQPGCAWSMEQVDNWLDIGSPSSGTGSGTARVDVQRYRGGSRERVGTMIIAGQTFTVTQTR